jgi:hypothetical protein
MQAWSVLYQGQARLIEEAAAAWGGEQEEPARRELAEELAAAVVRLAESLDRWRKVLWKMLFANQVRTTQQTGRFFLECVRTALNACGVVRACLEAGAPGNGLANLVDQVAEVHIRLAKMEERFSQRWPFLDINMLLQAQAEIERGELLTVEEICRELHI